MFLSGDVLFLKLSLS